LKAETSVNEPTENDRPNKSSNMRETKSLKESMEAKLKSNPSALGDPVSLKAETSDSEPTADDRGALGTSRAGKSKL
jgi:hypothetical protein